MTWLSNMRLCVAFCFAALFVSIVSQICYAYLDLGRNSFMGHLTRRMLDIKDISPTFDFRHVRWLNPGNSSEFCPDVTVNSKYAFVTYVGLNEAVSKDVRWYLFSAAKLAQSILYYTKKYDIIMMVAQDDGMTLSDLDLELILTSGWQLCYVPSISSSLNYHNRFHDAKIYTKFHVWRLKEYEAVVAIDSDMYAVGDPSYVFQKIWPDMVASNLTFGMGVDYPLWSAPRPLWQIMIGRCVPSRSDFNGGLFVLQPSISTFNALVSMINTDTYDLEMCEQGLLNAYFQNKTYVLPFALNVNVVTKACAPDLFHGSEKTFIHFTVAKPWKTSILAKDFMWTCPWWGLTEECESWMAQWH